MPFPKKKKKPGCKFGPNACNCTCQYFIGVVLLVLVDENDKELESGKGFFDKLWIGAAVTYHL